MKATVASDISNPPTISMVKLAAVSALAYVLADILHEFGHAAATLLPLGVRVSSISTIGINTTSVSVVVAIAGPLVNFVLGLALLFAFISRLSVTWRYFAWVLGTVNLFNATAYFLYSSALGIGDWAKVFGAVAPPEVWRPVGGVAGVVLYLASIGASVATLRHLCSSHIIALPNVNRYCTRTFWAGGVVVTAASVLNPFSPWYILTSGVATGFAAMLGLLAVPPLVQRFYSGPPAQRESLRAGWPWVFAGLVATAIFIGVFGPSLRL